PMGAEAAATADDERAKDQPWSLFQQAPAPTRPGPGARGRRRSQVWVWDLKKGSGNLITSTRSDAQQSRPVYDYTAVAFSADDQYLAAVAQDEDGRRHIVQVWVSWETPTPYQWSIASFHTGRITDVAFSPDHQYAVTASEDQTARVWLLTTPGIPRV